MPQFGAHIGGGLATSVAKAVGMTAECVQLFASAPQTWRPPAHKPEAVEAFRNGVAEAGLGPTILHGIYLLNPASPDEAMVGRTIGSVTTLLEWADQLGAMGAVIHLEYSLKDPREVGLERSAINLKTAIDRHQGSSLLLLETCAGQGNTIGRSFEDIGYLVNHLGDERVGVCLDTCHVYAAGYDWTTEEGLASMVEQFDRLVGLSRLRAVHLNDSKGALGSNLDRHENIGKGQIGEEAFARFLKHPAFANLPMYLEVPGYEGGGPDKQNLDTLRRLAAA